MSSSRLGRRRRSASSLVIPELDTEKWVSLTGYTNSVIDVSNQQQDEYKYNVRNSFDELPVTGLELSECGMDKPLKRKDSKLPINKIGFLSYLFATWLSPLVWTMFKNRSQPVPEVDIWECSDEEGVAANTERMKRLWAKEIETYGEKKCSLLRVWMVFIRSRTLAALCILTLNGLVTFASSAFLLNQIVAYLEAADDNLALGLGLTGAMLCCEVIRALSFSTLTIFAAQTGTFQVRQKRRQRLAIHTIDRRPYPPKRYFKQACILTLNKSWNLIPREQPNQTLKAKNADSVLLSRFIRENGTRFTSGFMGIMYDKMLKMRTIKGKTNSEIINIFSVDAYRVYKATWSGSFLLSVPVFLTISTVYCYILIGYWCFISMGTYTVCHLGQLFLTRFITSMRRQCIMYTDLRIRRMGEILNSMKFIKMYAWEKPFNDAIKDVRMSEQKYVLYSALLNALMESFKPATPAIASVITITLYTAAGNELRASTTFAVIGIMNFLRIIVALIPSSLRAYGEAKVSFARLRRLLLMEEYTPPSNDVFDKENVVEIKAANFIWDIISDPSFAVGKDRMKKKARFSRNESISNFVLTDIHLEVQQGKLVGICGSVGSGKSSLMSAIMGRMILQKGDLAVNGDIAYVAQQAWIFNATLKDNILFGREFEYERYQRVINVCGLEPDIRLLAGGDETEIGERGVNLSGGQKQRVNLARAVYSQSDIFILDDPLSALDVKVGSQIFNACIKGMLKDKTVLLVTHQLQYLIHCDEVVVIEEGFIAEKGQHHELLAIKGLYADMFRIFDQTIMKPRQHGGDTEPNAYIKNKEVVAARHTHEQNGTKRNGVLKPQKKAKGKLMLPEEAAVGDVGFGTYNAYIRAAGGWCVACMVLLAYLVSAGSLIFSDWWLSEWITSLSSTTSECKSKQDTPLINSTGNITGAPQNITRSLEQRVRDNAMFSYETYFNVYIASLAGIILLQLMTSFLGAKASIVASNRLHSQCLDKVMKAPMSFFDSNPVGRILNRFSKDLDEGDVFIPIVTNSFLVTFMLVILSVAMSAYIIPWILIAILPMVIVFYIMKQISKVSVRQLKRLENISRSPLISHVNVTSQGLSTIVAYKQQDRFFEKCTGLGNVASMSIFLFEASIRWIGLRLDLMAGVMSVSASLIFVLTKGLIAPASAGLVLGLCGKTVNVSQYLVKNMNETEARFTSIERLHEYNTTLTSEPQHAKKTVDPEWPPSGSVKFKDVVMRYRPDMDPVLRNLSFEIKAKEKIGVIGRTGAGKSSLVACLFRLNELSGGTNFVDGEDISSLHLNVIRSKISVITQEPVLFNGTIRYNIDPFSLYSDDSIWEALYKVHIKEKILEYDEGLEVMVEENGENFSVGERQLICLARALLRKNKILLLDEATANIDTTTDAMIQDTIKQCFSDCTVITIAHRLNTVLHSDKIIVLDSGQVMECASPQDLLSNPHSFLNAMISAQSVKSLSS